MEDGRAFKNSALWQEKPKSFKWAIALVHNSKIRLAKYIYIYISSHVFHQSLKFSQTKSLSLVFISFPFFLWQPRPPQPSFNQLGHRRAAKVGKKRKIGREGIGRRRSLDLQHRIGVWLREGAWPAMNALIHKNSELLHSKEELALGCLFIYVRAKIIFSML